MRILHAVHNYPPEFEGGIERVVESLVAAQARAGHQVSVLAGSEGSADDPMVRPERHGPATVRRVVRGKGFRDPVDPFRADLAAAIESVLDEAAPDVLHVHHWLNLGNDLVRRAARRGIPAVVTLHDAFATCGLLFRLPDQVHPCDQREGESACVPCIGDRFAVDAEEVRFRVSMRRAAVAAELGCAAAVLSPSESHASTLLPHLPSGIRVEVIPPGSPPASPAAWRTRTGALRVLHFGNLCRVKGVEFLARAVGAADPMGRDVRLTLAGPVVEPGMELGRASLAGAYDAERIRDLAADADVAFFPSFARESYGLVVDEALRLGLPVVVSDRGALPERIGKRGIALPAGDVRAWADAIARLAREPAELSRMRQGAHRPLATPDEHASQVLAVYAREASRRPPPVDLEGPMLARLAHFERRLGDLIHLLAQRKGVT